jgi:hypothetical protein
VSLNLSGSPEGTAQILEIPLSQFPRVNLHAVTGLSIDGARMLEGTHIRISSIEIVPEPGVPMLSLVSLTLLVFRRRRSC